MASSRVPGKVNLLQNQRNLFHPSNAHVSHLSCTRNASRWPKQLMSRSHVVSQRYANYGLCVTDKTSTATRKKSWITPCPNASIGNRSFHFHISNSTNTVSRSLPVVKVCCSIDSCCVDSGYQCEGSLARSSVCRADHSAKVSIYFFALSDLEALHSRLGLAIACSLLPWQFSCFN
jgi:hypothetical protein